MGVTPSGHAPGEAEPEWMEQALFEELLESVREAGAVLRGDREAARTTRIEDLVGGDFDGAH